MFLRLSTHEWNARIAESTLLVFLLWLTGSCLADFCVNHCSLNSHAKIEERSPSNFSVMKCPFTLQHVPEPEVTSRPETALRKRPVLIETPGRVHSYFRTFETHPPDGYQFVTGAGSGLVHGTRLRSIANQVSAVLPQKLLASLLAYPRRPAVDLTMAVGMVSFRSAPWIAVLESAADSFIGSRVERPFHLVVRNQLLRDDCRGILYFFESSRRSLDDAYGRGAFDDKLIHVPLGAPTVPKRKKAQTKEFNLVFIGSSNFNSVQWFYGRGGVMAVRAYNKLKSEFSNLRLTILADVPKELESHLGSDPRVEIRRNLVFGEEYNDILWKMDACLLPSMATPWMGFLDAMNHELPILTIGTDGNAEVVQDGLTGFVCDPPDSLRNITGTFYFPHRRAAREVARAWTQDTSPVVEQMVFRLRSLLKDRELARELGLNGRRELEPGGKFSLERRNRRLGYVMGCALSGSKPSSLD